MIDYLEFPYLKLKRLDVDNAWASMTYIDNLRRMPIDEWRRLYENQWIAPDEDSNADTGFKRNFPRRY